MSKSKTTKNKPPSQDRYEKDKPTVSARVPKEIRDRLRVNLAKQGKSLADALIAITNDLEIKGKSFDEAKQEGYEEAKERYMVLFPCDTCGELLPITSPKAKRAAGQFMCDAGWGHAKCHERRRQQ